MKNSLGITSFIWEMYEGKVGARKKSPKCSLL